MAAYESDLAMLDDVRDGKKAMMRTLFNFSCLADGNEYLSKVVEAAFDRGLSVVLDNHNWSSLPKGHWQPHLYVTHLDQVWRVSALRALRDTAFVQDGCWSLSAEAQESLLLGYTARQRARWIAWMRQRDAARSCLDLYTLLTPSQLRAARRLSMRCIGTPEQMEGMTFFFPRNGTAPRDNAATLVPKGLTFVRVGLAHRAAQKLFGPFKSWTKTWMSVRITADQALVINGGMKSNLQVMTTRGWK